MVSISVSTAEQLPSPVCFCFKNVFPSPMISFHPLEHHSDPYPDILICQKMGVGKMSSQSPSSSTSPSWLSTQPVPHYLPNTPCYSSQIRLIFLQTDNAFYPWQLALAFISLLKIPTMFSVSKSLTIHHTVLVFTTVSRVFSVFIYRLQLSCEKSTYAFSVHPTIDRPLLSAQ